MNVLLAGQKYFGSLVLMELYKADGINITCVCSPEKDDKTTSLADTYGLNHLKSGALNAETMPGGIDLIVAAHSHDFIGERTRLKAKYGGIGYHPSLLPVHRGRDAIKWTIAMHDKITGGSVYRLSNKVDGGNIIEQEVVFVRKGDTAMDLWARDLCPLGVKLLKKAVLRYRDEGFIAGRCQDESLATFEPAMSPPPLFKPDLIMLGNF